MSNVCSAGSDPCQGMAQCIPNAQPSGTESQHWDGVFWCPACGVMLRVVGDSSFRTWWRCGNSGRIPNDHGATGLPGSGRHEHHSAVYQVLPEFRDLYEFALGWSDASESEMSAADGSSPALPVDEGAASSDDNEYEQVELGSLLDAQSESGEQSACEDEAVLAAAMGEQGTAFAADREPAAENVHHSPSWWSVDLERSPSEPCEAEQGLLVALNPLELSVATQLAQGDLGSNALESSTQVAQPRGSLGDVSQESTSSTETREALDELEELLKMLMAPAEMDESSKVAPRATAPLLRSDEQSAGGGNTSIWKEYARKYSEQQREALPAESTEESSSAKTAACVDCDAAGSHTALQAEQRVDREDEPVRPSTPLAPELISYAPLTRDAIGIPLERKPRRRHLGAMLGISSALLGVVALFGYREVQVAAVRRVENPNAIRSLAMLRVPPPTPVAFELLLPRPTVEPVKVESELEADSPPAQLGPIPPRITTVADASAENPARRPSVRAGGALVAARRSEPRVAEQHPTAAATAFDAEAAEQAIAKAAERVQACRDAVTPAGEAWITVTFAPTGRVITTSVSGPPFAGTAAGSCIASGLYSVQVSPFNDPAAVTLSRTITIR